MEKQPMVSIYCLTYNHEKYIRDTLEGFVNQKTDFIYEVIVHDDASTDGTATIIREYEEKYPQLIKPIYQTENQSSKGVRVAKTFVYPKLTGKYIASCEGDDFWTDCEKLQRQVDVLEAHPEYSACVHQTEEWNCRTEEKRLMAPYEKDGCVKIENILSGGNAAFHFSSLMCKRENFIKRPEFCYAVKGIGDYPLFIYLAFLGKIYYLDRKMSVYRLFSNGSSWTSRISADQERWKKHCDAIINMLNMADEYSAMCYHQQIEHAIARHEYSVKRMELNKEILSEAKYRTFYKQEKKKDQLQLYVRIKFPGIYRVWKKIK